MRIIKISLITLLAVITCLYGFTMIRQRVSGAQEGPQIQCSADTLEVSVSYSEEELLPGVTASDAQDGDLTDKIIVGGISKLITNDTAKVTYLVFDSDSNMARFVRYIRYTDYQRPRLQLTEPLVFADISAASPSGYLQASDVIDGNLTDAVRISTLSTTDRSNVYRVVAQVTNSMGDTARVELPVIIQNANMNYPAIRLTDYLVYLEAGSEFDAADYLSAVTAGGSAVSVQAVDISHSVDTNTSGSYWVVYSYTSGGVTGLAILTVVIP